MEEGRREMEEEKRQKKKKDVVVVAVPLKEGRECALFLHHQAPANETREPCATRWLARLLPRTTFYIGQVKSINSSASTTSTK